MPGRTFSAKCRRQVVSTSCSTRLERRSWSPTTCAPWRSLLKRRETSLALVEDKT